VDIYYGGQLIPAGHFEQLVSPTDTLTHTDRQTDTQTHVYYGGQLIPAGHFHQHVSTTDTCTDTQTDTHRHRHTQTDRQTSDDNRLSNTRAP